MMGLNDKLSIFIENLSSEITVTSLNAVSNGTHLVRTWLCYVYDDTAAVAVPEIDYDFNWRDEDGPGNGCAITVMILNRTNKFLSRSMTSLNLVDDLGNSYSPVDDILYLVNYDKNSSKGVGRFLRHSHNIAPGAKVEGFFIFPKLRPKASRFDRFYLHGSFIQENDEWIPIQYTIELSDRPVEDSERSQESEVTIYRDKDEVDSQNILSALIEKGGLIFLEPKPLYSWDDIVLGCAVARKKGSMRSMAAVSKNTWRGFHKISKVGKGASDVFNSYFVGNKDTVIGYLEGIRNKEELDKIENFICEEIREELRKNIKHEQLNRYNKVRKPIDLYIEHLVAMSEELDVKRPNLIPLLSVPLDSWILASPVCFTSDQLSEVSVYRGAPFSEVRTELQYRMLQGFLRERANEISHQSKAVFHPIYFDLLWSDRYMRWGGNLFETNP
jgi:hypothetical protein